MVDSRGFTLISKFQALKLFQLDIASRQVGPPLSINFQTFLSTCTFDTFRTPDHYWSLQRFIFAFIMNEKNTELSN